MFHSAYFYEICKNDIDGIPDDDIEICKIFYTIYKMADFTVNDTAFR